MMMDVKTRKSQLRLRSNSLPMKHEEWGVLGVETDKETHP